jgi:tetratricopeptide (TPR) repeat protein
MRRSYQPVTLVCTQFMEPTPVSSHPEPSTRRRWRVPPANSDAFDAPETASVLEEIPGALGLVLWQSLQDVLRWTSVAPADRDGLFPGDAEMQRLISLVTAKLPTALEAPTGTIAAMLGRPAAARAERIKLSCCQIAQWGESEGKSGCALAFLHTAALVCPGDAQSAFKVGRLLRQRADYAPAEAWFRRAALLARQSADWTIYASAFVGLGTLYMQRGNFPAARRFHMRALRASRRFGLRDIEGGVLHELFAVSIHADQAEEAHAHARGAFEAYGPAHVRLPHLAHDVAYFWATQGRFTPALSVLQALLPHFGTTNYRVVLLSSIARAAGGAKESTVYEQVWDELWRTTARQDRAEGNTEACLELARGAASLRQWERARNAAARAVELAEIRKEGRIIFAAEALLQSVRHSCAVENRLVAAVPPLLRDQVEEFAEDFIRCLEMTAAAS